jgi:hypothetical protein
VCLCAKYIFADTIYAPLTRVVMVLVLVLLLRSRMDDEDVRGMMSFTLLVL